MKQGAGGESPYGMTGKEEEREQRKAVGRKTGKDVRWDREKYIRQKEQKESCNVKKRDGKDWEDEEKWLVIWFMDADEECPLMGNPACSVTEAAPLKQLHLWMKFQLQCNYNKNKAGKNIQH